MFSFSFLHFYLSSSVNKYSLLHLSQNDLIIRCLSFHKRTPTVVGFGSIANGSGVIIGSPTKICSGVSDCMSFGSSLNGVSGRELRMACTWSSRLLLAAYKNFHTVKFSVRQLFSHEISLILQRPHKYLLGEMLLVT